MNSTTIGRREQKKAATRQALQQAAMRMFEERGYDGTTVKDIAKAAGVTERTFFRYFPSKEDLVLGGVLDLLPRLQEEILKRPMEEPPLTAVLNGLLSIVQERDDGLAVLFSGHPSRFIAGPTRPASAILFDFEKGIVEVLEERLAGEDPDRAESPQDDGMRASVLARTGVAAMRCALIALADLRGDRPFPEAAALFTQLLRSAFAVLDA